MNNLSSQSRTKYEVRDSTIGLGLFARAPIAVGNRVIEYTGKRLSTPDADELNTKFLFDLENGFTIDGEGLENIARYVNHSCFPNCEAEIVGEQIFFNAIRDIDPGEELTIDYGSEYFDEFIKPIGCRCTTCK